MPGPSSGPAGTSGIRIEVDRKSLVRLQRALELLGEDRATWLRDAWDDVGREFAAATRRRAPGSISNTVVYKGLGRATTVGGLKAFGAVTHPGARSMEFGRIYYWRGFRRPGGRKSRYVGGWKSRSEVGLGQLPRPYLGVMSELGAPTGATGDVMPFARRKLAEAADRMWERIAQGAND